VPDESKPKEIFKPVFIMKPIHNYFTIISLLVSTNLSTFGQQTNLVTLRLKNNSLFPRHFKFLERHPDVSYRNVFTAFILPGQAYTVKLKAGTILAQVTQREINANMQGRTAPGQLLTVVRAEDNGRTIPLIERKIRQ
jgi:hypothetical protein